MNRKLILLAAVLLLCGCPEEEAGSKSSKSSKAEAARIEKEVQQRVAVVEKDLKVRQQQLRTIRVVSFVLLAGGAVGGLVWLQRYRSYSPPQPEERHLQMPGWRDHYTVPTSRVLELPSPARPAPTLHAPPAPQAARSESDNLSRRRRASRHRRRNRNRNQNYDETPRDR